MDGPRGRFDLTLAYPQWQGSGRHENLPRGAQAAAAVCALHAPLLAVPPSATGGDAHGVHRWGAIFEQFERARDILARSRPNRVLTAGGDCSVDVAVIDYLHGLHPSLNVVWVDAHLDANTPETSPSGNFHGMPVSAVLGRAPEPMRRLMGPPLDPARFLYCGVRVGDDEEWAFRRDHGLRLLGPEMRLEGPVHVHFDLDVLDPGEFPYLAYPEPGGMSVGDAIGLVDRIARECDIVGLTITEFAPANEDEAGEGSKVIARLCDAAGRQ
jgi:arginase